jgi:hypothetical protein
VAFEGSRIVPDWIELCALFSAHRVEFLLVGGQAVIAHGYPRLTKDMDLWIRPTRENGERVQVPLISRDDLIANKKAVGRFQDLADVEALESVDRIGRP